MRIGFVVMLAVALGLLMGALATLPEFGFYKYAIPKLDVSDLPKHVEGPPPALVVKEADFDFGQIELGGVARHVFVLGNDGPGVLTLGEPHPACNCTVPKVSRKEIQPGESAEVTVEWHPKTFTGTLERKSVTIQTNDPKRSSLVLTVQGTAVGTWRLQPESVNFFGFGARESRQVSTDLLVYRGAPCEIRGHHWGNINTAQYFELIHRQLTPDELAKLSPAPTSGHRVTLVARKGMPLGPFSQSAQLDTTLATMSPVNIMMFGTVTARSAEPAAAAPAKDPAGATLPAAAASSALTTEPTPNELPPKLVIKEPVHEFGEMDQSAVGRHSFVVENVGPGILKLGPGTASCACSIYNISRQEVPPGESATVTVEWRPANMFGKLDKSFTFPTNDPQRPRLVLNIRGNVVVAWRLEPTSVSFHDLSTTETRETTANLLIYRGEKCEILRHKWGTVKAAEHLGLIYEEMEPADLAKLSPTPKSGYKLTFTARKGMPAGPLVETVTLDTTLQTATPITLTAYGHVSEDIMLMGHRMLRTDPLLYLGTVQRGTQQQAELQIRLIGDHRNSTTFSVKKVVPEDLQVTFGKPAAGYGGRSLLVPMKVVLPADAKPQSWLSSKPEEMGQIVIETTHPDYKELKILVRLAVMEPQAKGKE